MDAKSSTSFTVASRAVSSSSSAARRARASSASRLSSSAPSNRTLSSSSPARRSSDSFSSVAACVDLSWRDSGSFLSTITRRASSSRVTSARFSSARALPRDCHRASFAVSPCISSSEVTISFSCSSAGSGPASASLPSSFLSSFFFGGMSTVATSRPCLWSRLNWAITLLAFGPPEKKSQSAAPSGRITGCTGGVTGLAPHAVGRGRGEREHAGCHVGTGVARDDGDTSRRRRSENRPCENGGADTLSSRRSRPRALGRVRRRRRRERTRADGTIAQGSLEREIHRARRVRARARARVGAPTGSIRRPQQVGRVPAQTSATGDHVAGAGGQTGQARGVLGAEDTKARPTRDGASMERTIRRAHRLCEIQQPHPRAQRRHQAAQVAPRTASQLRQG